jgi:hypothetical protein
MKTYRSLELGNRYSENDINVGFRVLNTAGIHTRVDEGNIVLDFDVVDMRYIESQRHQTDELLENVLGELLKIRSFSSANGKIVFKSFNKEKRVCGKTENRKKRLGYEAFQKHFSAKNNEVPQEYLNKIVCADSLETLSRFPDNCVDLIFTSPPYNFGINYNNTDDVNTWQNYFDTLFVIFGECVRVLKSGGRMVVNIQPLYSDYVPSHHLISNFFVQQGLIWKGEIIWEKKNYNCK